jgi:hypothetical protein
MGLSNLSWYKATGRVVLLGAIAGSGLALLPSVLGLTPGHLFSQTRAVAQTPNPQWLWQTDFATTPWEAPWKMATTGTWGETNAKVIADPTKRFGKVLRVQFPAGSASPAVNRATGAPLGGTEFRGTLGMAPQKRLYLSYFLRFSDNFDFVKGGKLPGLYGGTEISGGNIPDGTNGFSTRFMWRTGGQGEVYAYVPSSVDFGLSLGRGKWTFRPGTWHRLEQQLTLNTPGQSDGRVQVWLDGKLVLDAGSLMFRTVDRLAIDGVFFSTFFGGNDASWATPKTVHIDFAQFRVAAQRP